MIDQYATRPAQIRLARSEALKILKTDGPAAAYARFVTVMMKNPSTQFHVGLAIGATLMAVGHISMPEQMRDWLEGFV